MSLRYGKQTFALELGMIFVALLFLFPVYVLVTLSFKNPPEISAGGLGLPSSLETENYSQAWSGAHLGAAMINSTIITGISLVDADRRRLHRLVLPRAQAVAAQLRHVPAVPAGDHPARSSSRWSRSTGW